MIVRGESAFWALVEYRTETGNVCPIDGCGDRIGPGQWWCESCELAARQTFGWADLETVLDATVAVGGSIAGYWAGQGCTAMDLARGAAKVLITAELDAAQRVPS